MATMEPLCLALILFLSSAGLAKGQQVSLIAIGEWGDGSTQQTDVANAMSSYATENPTQSIVTCGDNIFPSGATSPTDPKFNTVWKNEYNLAGLSNLPWYIALGQVDYGPTGSGNDQNEINHSDPDWILPKNYHDYVTSSGVTEIHVIIIDTVAIMNQLGDWDTMLNTWLPQTLNNSTSPYNLVVGYHPIFSAGKFGPINTVLYDSLRPILQTNGANSYISAQENNIQDLVESAFPNLSYFISGGGAGQTKTPLNETAKVELEFQYGVTVNLFEPLKGFVAYLGSPLGTISQEITLILGGGRTKTVPGAKNYVRL